MTEWQRGDVPRWVFDMLEAEGIDPARVPADSGVYILGSTVHVEVYDPEFRSTTTRTFPVGQYEPLPVPCVLYGDTTCVGHSACRARAEAAAVEEPAE